MHHTSLICSGREQGQRRWYARMKHTKATSPEATYRLPPHPPAACERGLSHVSVTAERHGVALSPFPCAEGVSGGATKSRLTKKAPLVSKEAELGCESWTSFASGCSSTAVQRTLSL